MRRAFMPRSARIARQSGIQRLLALGELSREAVREFGAGAQHFETPKACARVLAGELDDRRHRAGEGVALHENGARGGQVY